MDIVKINHLAEDMETDMRRMVSLHNSSNVTRMPAAHSPGVDEVGRLTGEALTLSYENAAAKIEEMGRQLMEDVKSCEQSSLEVVRELDRYKEMTLQAVNECKAAAEAYRSEARSLFEHVQSRCIIADKVRKTCKELSGEIVKVI